MRDQAHHVGQQHNRLSELGVTMQLEGYSINTQIQRPRERWRRKVVRRRGKWRPATGVLNRQCRRVRVSVETTAKGGCKAVITTHHDLAGCRDDERLPLRVARGQVERRVHLQLHRVQCEQVGREQINRLVPHADIDERVLDNRYVAAKLGQSQRRQCIRKWRPFPVRHQA
jgi:hypothetical protein